MTRKFLVFFFIQLIAIFVSGASAEQPKKFLVFDRKLDSSWIAAHANKYVFVWGATESTENEFRTLSPNTHLSKYFPYARDPDPSHGLSFWAKAGRGNWVAYKCGGLAAAVFSGDKNIPLDIANPQVIDWQIDAFAKGAESKGTVALDNFQFRNTHQVCGYKSSTGKFVKRYSGGLDDPRFSEDVVSWIEHVALALHKRNLKVVINHIPDIRRAGPYASPDIDSPLSKRIIDAVDGLLDEKTNLMLVSKGVAEEMLRYADYARKKNRWMYFSYQFSPSSASSVESAVASYLEMAYTKSAMYIADRSKGYGGEPAFYGYDRDVGKPCHLYENRKGVLIRMFDHGMAIFSLPGQSRQTVKLPSGFRDVDGHLMPASIIIEAGQGRVFYHAEGGACSIKSP